MIIAVLGKAQAGKDTFAQIVKEQLSWDIQRLAFADPIKRIAREIGWNERKDEKGRQLLMDIGEGGRAHNPNIWVNIVRDKILKIPRSVPIVVTDVRRYNELEMLKKFGAVTVRIVRQDTKNSLTTEQQQHVSETELDDYLVDYTIINDGNIDNYAKQVKLCLENLKVFNVY